MTPRPTFRRPWGPIAATVVGLLALVALVSPPVSAIEKGSISIAEGKPSTATYPATTASDPSRPSVQAPPAPGTCKTSSACDHVLLKITPPTNIKTSDEWFVTVELSWAPQKVDATDTVDMDLYLWDTDAVFPTRPLVQSASSDNPERVRIFVPPKREYSLSINTAGRPSPYKLTTSMRVDRITAPAESRDNSGPPPSSSASTGSGGFTAPPASPSSGPVPSSASFAPEASTSSPPTTAFEYTPLPGDPELQALAADQLDSIIKGGSQLLEGEDRAAAIAPAGKVGAGVAVLWLAVLPAALAAALAFFLIRRQPKALKAT